MDRIHRSGNVLWIRITKHMQIRWGVISHILYVYYHNHRFKIHSGRRLAEWLAIANYRQFGHWPIALTDEMVERAAKAMMEEVKNHPIPTVLSYSGAVNPLAFWGVSIQEVARVGLVAALGYEETPEAT